MNKISALLLVLCLSSFVFSQEETNWLLVKSNILGINENLGYFTQLTVNGDLSLMPLLKGKSLEFGGNNFVMRWNELKGQLNGAFFYEKREQLHDADLTTGFRIKALKNWPLILDFDLGWTNYNYVDSISNTTRLPMVNNVILQPHLWYVLSNSATTTSAVWHRMVLDADLDVRTMQDQRASSEFNAGIRYDMKSSDLNIPAQDQTFETWVGAGIGCRYLNSIKNNYADQWFADGFFIIGKKTVQTLLNFGVKIDLPGVGLKVEYEPRANRVSNWAILLNEPLNFLN